MLKLKPDDVLERIGEPEILVSGKPMRVRVFNVNDENGQVKACIMPTEGGHLFGHVVLAIHVDGYNWARIGRFEGNRLRLSARRRRVAVLDCPF